MCSSANSHSVVALELLAPARNYTCGVAAIHSGADAIYTGGPAFGAREAAANEMREVERLARYGQRYGVKTYLTLNTLLYPQEYEAARQIAYQAWEAGCAAIIIQDPVLLELGLPPIPLFASTQMDNRTMEQVQRLERLGFARVILARELSLQQIAAIRAHTTVPLEFFVHGALCVCYSGRCYLSEHLTERSANRGGCIQACRNRYNLEDATGRVLVSNQHLLSLYDLRLDNHLEKLIAAGITSFKIEGRLKNSSYITNVVAHYRRRLDAIIEGRNNAGSAITLKKTSLGHSEYTFEPNVERTFSRGHTLYYIEGKRSDWATMAYGKARGADIGTIIPHDDRFLVTLRPHVTLSCGDGICYFNTKGELTGSVINAISPLSSSQSIITLRSAEAVGADNTLYRTYDHLFEKELTHPHSAKRIIKVVLQAEIQRDSVILQAQIPDGISHTPTFAPPHTFTLVLPHSGVPAKQPEQANLQIRKQLEKTSQSLYLFGVTSLTNPHTLFFPAAQINHWRRLLGEALLEASDRHFASPLRTAASPDPLALRQLKQHIPPAGTIPSTLMHCKYCIKYQLGWCHKEGLNEPLYLVNQGKRLRLEFDCANCEMKVLEK